MAASKSAWRRHRFRNVKTFSGEQTRRADFAFEGERKPGMGPGFENLEVSIS
jgi:hypothetical protein